MDLGISGKKALVCASSKGLGLGCAQSLAAEGVNLVMNARGAELLEKEGAAIRAKHGVQVECFAGDITQESTRDQLFKAHPHLDILINNAGGPPPGDFRQFEREHWIAALNGNMLTPIELIKFYLPGMQAQKFGRIVNITSSAVKAPIDFLALSNGARSGLTGFVAGLSRATIADGVTINNLLPGLFDTERAVANFTNAAKKFNITMDEARARRESEIPAKRLGNSWEFGQACAFLCSMQAAYMTGQNVLLDGGSYPGTF